MLLDKETRLEDAQLNDAKYLIQHGLGFSIIQIEKLTTGLTNDNYQVVTLEAGKLIVKFFANNSELLKIERETEIRCLQIAHQLKAAPKVLDYDLTAGWLIIDANLGLDWHFVKPKQRDYQRLALQLKALHQIKQEDYPQAAIKPCLVRQRIESYTSYLEAHPLIKSQAFQLLTESLQHRMQQLKVPKQLCLTHNDLSFGNILDVSEKEGHRNLLLIDWEYAGWGDPIYDLAVICADHKLSPNQQKAFLTHYLGKFDNDTWHKLKNMIWIYHYYCILWALMQDSTARENKADFLTYARTMLKQLSEA